MLQKLSFSISCYPVHSPSFLLVDVDGTIWSPLVSFISVCLAFECGMRTALVLVTDQLPAVDRLQMNKLCFFRSVNSFWQASCGLHVVYGVDETRWGGFSFSFLRDFRGWCYPAAGSHKMGGILCNGIGTASLKPRLVCCRDGGDAFSMWMACRPVSLSIWTKICVACLLFQCLDEASCQRLSTYCTKMVIKVG